MFEHYQQPLLPRHAFLKRILSCMAISFSLLAFTLLVGTVVFYRVEQLPWIDALLNSVMIMTGLGLVSSPNTADGKIFVTFYAIFSTLAFFSILAIIFTPFLHRLLHRLHLDIESRQD